MVTLLDLLIAYAIKSSFLLFHGSIALFLATLCVTLLVIMVWLMCCAWKRIRKEISNEQ